MDTTTSRPQESVGPYRLDSHKAKLIRANQQTPQIEARTIQRVIFQRIMEPKVTDAALAQLSRSWCLVCDALRELRGIPKAGQMRPDLDPVQAMKAMRRLRSRMPLEVAGSAVDITEDEQSETDTKESL